jgi:CRT-like, chloroquine-resistance transporter-like
LNGWIVVFQTMYSFILAVPAGMASTPAVLPKDVPQNLLDGVKCYLDINTIEDGCHPDDCSSAALYFNLSICVNVFYILAAMFVVKWGSTSLLFLGLTIMVPLGNLAFAILPSKARTTFHVSDILGLLVILLGLLLYRFSSGSESDDVSDENSQRQPEDEIDVASVEDNALDGLKEPLLQADSLESQAVTDLLAGSSSVLPHMDSSIPLDHQEICEEQSLSPPCPRTVDL